MDPLLGGTTLTGLLGVLVGVVVRHFLGAKTPAPVPVPVNPSPVQPAPLPLPQLPQLPDWLHSLAVAMPYVKTLLNEVLPLLSAVLPLLGGLSQAAPAAQAVQAAQQAPPVDAEAVVALLRQLVLEKQAKQG